MKWGYNILSNGSQIEIHNLKKVNLKGGILIDVFLSVGLITAILSMCFMNPEPNDLVSVMDSPLFLSISLVHDAIADSLLGSMQIQILMLPFLSPNSN